MTAVLKEVLAEVEARVPYLRAVVARGPVGSAPVGPAPVAAGSWIACDELTPGALRAAIDAGTAAKGSSPPIAASLFSQSYAFKVGATSLAAYALGLPWPSPAAADTSVVLARGRATALAYRSELLGRPDDGASLGEALLERHLVAFSTRLRHTVRLGARLVAGNVAAASAAAFRAVEGAARDRGDPDERAAVRARAEAFFRAPAVERRLRGAGRFEIVAIPDKEGRDGWFWTRTSCCLWYQVAGTAGTPGTTCDDCSLIAAPDLERRRRAELSSAPPKDAL